MKAYTTMYHGVFLPLPDHKVHVSPPLRSQEDLTDKTLIADSDYASSPSVPDAEGLLRVCCCFNAFC
jgi:hypothetical protein